MILKINISLNSVSGVKYTTFNMENYAESIFMHYKNNIRNN